MIHLFIHSFIHSFIPLPLPKLERFRPTCTRREVGKVHTLHACCKCGQPFPMLTFLFSFFFFRFPCCWFGVVRSDESSASLVWFGCICLFFFFFPNRGPPAEPFGRNFGCYLCTLPTVGKGKEGGNWLAVVSKNTRSCAAVFVTTNNAVLAVCLFVCPVGLLVCVCVDNSVGDVFVAK